MRERALLAAGVLIVALPLLLAGPASAVLEDNLGALTGPQTQGYLGPFADGLSGMMNSGIFRSGNVPVTGFSLTLDARASYISFSDDQRTYSASTPGYPTVDAPTVVGDTQSVTAHNSTTGVDFTYPGGFDMKNFGIAVPQATVGSVLGTRAIVRYIAIDLGSEDIGKLKLFGIGGQHSISQYLPALPVDVAVGAMWQDFKIGEDLLDAKAFAANVMGSKKFGKIVSLEPYVGLGVDSFTLDAKYTSGNDKVEVNFDRKNDFHLTLGTNINLPVVKLNAEFNHAAVTGFAGGVSFGF
jgi:hypothetical protein